MHQDEPLSIGIVHPGEKLGHAIGTACGREGAGRSRIAAREQERAAVREADTDAEELGLTRMLTLSAEGG